MVYYEVSGFDAEKTEKEEFVMKKLRVGVIGCGRISVMHLVSASYLDEAELVACCDIKEDRANAAAEKYGIKAYTDYIKMLDEEKLDAVHICLPHYLHTKVACDAFSRGVNVLSEKPMDIDYKSAENAVKLAKECGVLYGVIFQCRYNNAPQLVKKRVTDGSLGKIITARSTLTWTRSDEYYSMSDWKGTWDKEGGGVVIDQAIHSIDLVNWIVDSEVENISVSMENRGHKIVKVEDTADGLIDYKNGVRYGFWCMNNYGCDEPIEIRFFCEKGKVTLTYDDAYIKYNDGSSEEAHKDVVTHNYGGGKDYWGSMHIKQIKQFYRSCLGLEELEISGEHALKTHKLICDLYDKGGMRK
jgi:predicted dehydrogenase